MLKTHLDKECERMTNERLMEKAQEHEKLISKAQSLIGSWIYDISYAKTYKDEYLYVYDIYDDGCKYDVKLCCIAIDLDNDVVPYVKETEVWMSEFDEYYRKASDTKCIKAWKKIKKHYDKMFKGRE